VELGSEVTGLKQGQRATASTTMACGKCFYCHRGDFLQCENLDGIGVEINGAFAEYIKLRSDLVFPIETLSVRESVMKEEAAKDGVDLNLTVANQDLSKQLNDVEDFITKGVNAIIISPVDSKGVKGAVLKAQKAGIPVITVDIAATGTDVTSHVATDNYVGFSHSYSHAFS
jgi:hypothetical protein